MPGVAAASALPNGMTAFALPNDGYAHSPIATFGWDPVASWTPAPTAPVPYIVGNFPE